MIRLVGFEAQNFRSLRHLVIGTLAGTEPLPPLVLLYGQNDVGKSNILRAVETWFIFLRSFREQRWPMGPLQEFELPREPLESTFTHGTASLTLTGELELMTPRLSGRLTLSVSLAPEMNEKEQLEYTLALSQAGFCQRGDDGILQAPRRIFADRLAGPNSSDDQELGQLLNALGEALERPWTRIGAERRWHPEGPVDIKQALPWLPPLDCSDLKQRLLRARNSRLPVERARFEKRFADLLRQKPFALKDPSTVLEERGGPGFYVEDHPIEERGSGPQQWALIAGVLSMTDPLIAGLEEPEVNLSWEAQQAMSRALLSELAGEQRLQQLWVTSHVPSLYDARDFNAGVVSNGIWLEVTKGEDGFTSVTARTTRDGLIRYFPTLEMGTPPPQDKKAFQVFPGGFFRLDERAYQHLKIKEDFMQWIGYELDPSLPTLLLYGVSGYSALYENDVTDEDSLEHDSEEEDSRDDP